METRDETQVAKGAVAAAAPIKALDAFCEAVSAGACLRPAEALPLVCSSWRDEQCADWVWLWLYNEFTNKWEAVAYEPAGSANLVPQSEQGPGFVASYCHEVQEPLYVADLRAWEATVEGRHYSVGIAEHLMKIGGAAMECVPLLWPQAAEVDGPSGPLPRYAVTLHYRDGRRQPSDSRALLLMGRMTASAIAGCYMTEQRAVLADINAITEKHWRYSERRAAERRKAFLADVVRMIQERLNVQYVSVFWVGERKDRLTCLYSTGLYDAQGRPVAEKDLPLAAYTSGEGITGEVVISGLPFIGAGAGPVSGKYTEIPPAGELNQDSVLVCPMPFRGGGLGRQETGGVRGVIRCAGARAAQFVDRRRSFDSIQVEMLGFVTRQVAPILEGLAVNVKRELTTSIVKHDLFAPLRMIMDAAEEADQTLKAHQRLPESAMDDLRTSAFIAEQLVRQLDPEPAGVRKLFPEPTFLGGHIVARMKGMLAHYARNQAGMSIVFGDFSRIPPVKVDRVQIERVFGNLIINAIKYGREGTAIEVMPVIESDRLIVTVSNFGLGVEPDEAPYLFTEDYRSPRAERRAHGLGLGLKVARAAMVAHGGDLVLSRAKEPTVFSIILPKEAIVVLPAV